MKEKILAVTLLVAVLGAVTVNTIMLNRQIGGITDMLSSLDVSDDDAQKKLQNIREKYEQNKDFVSLTVSHVDLTSVDECFIELTGYITEKNLGEAEIAKNRLTFYLEHIRRLSGFNIDSII